MKHQIGILGLIVGLIAVGIAIFQNDILAEPAPETPVYQDSSLKDLAVEAGKKLIHEKLLSDESEAEARHVASDPTKEAHNWVQLVYMGLGFVAIVLGVVSWVRKDHIRISGGAVALGLVAVAWQFVLIGIGVAVFVFIIANLGA